MSVDADTLRETFARRAAGVSVVTTVGEEGLQGLTATAFCPLSTEPPLVLVSLERVTRTAEQIAARGAYGVSLLGGRQSFLADRFAGRGPLVNSRFDGAPYFTAVTGSPLLQGCLAWLDCRVVATHTVGDHCLFVGSVEAAGSGEATSALVYFDHAYHAVPLVP